MSKSVSDSYLKGLITKDEQVIRLIYQEFAPRIEAMVSQHNGNREDARDVFQEGLLIFWRKANTHDFELTSSFYSFLYGVCYFTWQRKRKKKANNTVTIPDSVELIDEADIQLELEESEKYRLYKDHFSALGPDCRKLLNLFFQELSMQEIASRLKIKNIHAARNRKYRCQKKLENSILNDPKYPELSSK